MLCFWALPILQRNKRFKRCNASVRLWNISKFTIFPYQNIRLIIPNFPILPIHNLLCIRFPVDIDLKQKWIEIVIARNKKGCGIGLVCGSHFSASQYMQGKVPPKLKSQAFPDQHMGVLKEKEDPPYICNDFHRDLNNSVQVSKLKDEVKALKDSKLALEKKCTDLNRQNMELRKQLQSMNASLKNQSVLDSDTKVCEF